MASMETTCDLCESKDDQADKNGSPRPVLKKNVSNLSLSAAVKKSFRIPVILLVVFTVPASFLYGMSLLASGVIVLPDACNEDKGFENSTVLLNVTFILQNILVFVLFPVAGWLSDTKLGRYRAIYYSVWVMWLGVGITGLSYFARYVQPCSNDGGVLFILGKYVIPILALIVISIGAAGYFPNILAFILEQLIESSSALIRSYIYWFVWALFLGFLFADWVTIQLYIDDSVGDIDQWFIIPVFCCFFIFSAVLVVFFFFEKMFLSVFSIKKNNPYSIVFQVIVFAVKHKYPVNRSSLTFWEEELPGRLDLAKEKYGGPLRHEEVEDVKTLFRIILLFLSFLPFFIGYAGPLNQLVPFIRHLQSSENTADVLLVYFAEPGVTLVAVPILELIILPLFPKFEYFIQKPLRWMFVSMVGLVLCNISLVIIDYVAHDTASDTETCFINTDGEQGLNFNFRWAVLSMILWGICDLLIATSIFTFICSQAPYNMNGMLLGLFMFMQGIFEAIGSFITLGFGESSIDFKISCGLWYWFTLAIVSIFGCIVFFVAARLYNPRVRWEVDRYREVIENIYERQLQATDTFSFSYVKVVTAALNESHEGSIE